jgi:preprotein translocase subunit SecE
MNPAEERAPDATRVIIVSLWLVVLTQKFALPGNIEVVLPIMIAVVAYMFLRGMSRLSLTHAMIFSGLAGLILFQQVLLFGSDFSYLAFMLMVGIYFPFMFVTQVTRPDYDRILRSFQVIAAFIALMVYLQWACQFLIGWFPHLELVAPQSLMYQRYNYISPIQWGSSLMRPNGIFMLEPSHGSQVIAMGAVFEAALFRRTRYLLILLPGIFVIFAGTGLLLAICCVPFILAQMNWRYLVRLAAVVAVVIAFAGALGMFDYLGNRIQEFGKEGTSAHGRFIGTYTVVLSTLYESTAAGTPA